MRRTSREWDTHAERKKTFGRWKWAWPVHRPSLKRQRNGNKSIKREKESPHQHAQNPRADAFISLFAIPSLARRRRRGRQATAQRERTRRHEWIDRNTHLTTSQKSFQDDDRVTIACAIDQMAHIPSNKKREREKQPDVLVWRRRKKVN